MLRTPVLALAVLSAAPAVYAAARGHHDLSFPVTLASITGAAGLSLAVDDPAEATLTPCPVARSSRRTARVGLIAVTLAASWVIVAICANAANYDIELFRTRLAETVAAATISMAFAARAANAGSDSPGIAAVTATLVTFGTVSGLALYLTWLPQLGHPPHTTRWWIIATFAAAFAWWWSRDPSTRVPLVHRSVRYRTTRQRTS